MARDRKNDEAVRDAQSKIAGRGTSKADRDDAFRTLSRIGREENSRKR